MLITVIIIIIFIMLDRVRSGWLGKCICLPGELHIIMAWNKMKEALRPWFQALIDNMSRGITICPSNKDKFLVFFCLFVWLLQHIIPVFLKASSWSVEWVFFSLSFFLPWRTAVYLVKLMAYDQNDSCSSGAEIMGFKSHQSLMNQK